MISEFDKGPILVTGASVVSAARWCGCWWRLVRM